MANITARARRAWRPAGRRQGASGASSGLSLGRRASCARGQRAALIAAPSGLASTVRLAAAARASQSGVRQHNWAGKPVEFAGNHRADDHDRIALQHQDRRRPLAEAQRLGKRGAARTRPAPARHHQHTAYDARATLRMQAIDDRSRRRIEPAPEAERLIEAQNTPRSRAGNERDGAEYARAHSRTTLPARAEATHSTSDP